MTVQTIKDFLPDMTAKPDKAFQLVKHRNQVSDKLKRYPAFLQHKEDGVFTALVVRGDMKARAFGRSGKMFNEHVQGRAIRLASGLRPGVYLCEWVCRELSLEQLSGILNPNRVEPLTPEQGCALGRSQLAAFDFLTLSAFEAGGTATGFVTRHQCLRNRLDVSHDDIYPLPYAVVMSEDQIEELALAYIERGGEGVVVKTDDAYQAWHRGPRQTKVVSAVSYDLKCVKVEQGRGKRAGMVANAIVLWKDGQELPVDLGRGFSDAKRVHLWNNPEEIEGHIVQVDALKESSKGVLRLPKVSAIRIDKEQPDV